MIRSTVVVLASLLATSQALAGAEFGKDHLSMKISGRVQARATYEVLDGDDEMSFSVPRARLKLGGNAFSESLGYALQLDFGKGGASLKDAYFDWKPVSGLKLRAGQFKRPFSRQQLTSSSKLELVDRAITDKGFGAGRDIGVMAHSGVGSNEGLEWAVGVFNGTGDKAWFDGDVLVDTTTGEGEVTSGKFTNVPSQWLPTAVVRVGYNNQAKEGYSEGALAAGGLMFGVGASGLVELTGDAPAMRAEVDAIVKVSGFAATAAVSVSTAGVDSPFSDASMDALGLFGQASYFFADHYQVAARYARVDPSGDDDATQEILGGVSVYAYGHKVKVQADAGPMMYEADGGSTDLVVRAQAQVSF